MKERVPPHQARGAVVRRRAQALFPLLLGGVSCLATACDRAGAPLGPPDSYVIYEPVAGAGEALTPPLMRAVPVEDPRAVPVHRAAVDGFVGEMLRTDYLAKELIRTGSLGQPFSAAAQARALEPTVLVIAGARATPTESAATGVGLQTTASFGRKKVYPTPMWIEVGDDPVSDPAFVQTASGRVARLIAERVSGAFDSSGPAPRALIDGYALAMEVIGREWRVGEGPMGRMAPDAGTGTQRERFAAVRQNSFVFVPDSQRLRPAQEILNDPGVVAALIYRMAESKGVGRKIAPAEIYAPFVKDRVPPGVSPAAVLGPIRNFQVKLLSAWARAIAAGHPPHDLAELVTAYVAAMPAERGEAIRLFVVTTFGVTVKPGGVSALPADASTSLAELTALAAEITAGHKTIREGMHP
ncbi:MAG TPA: hypothetical protein VGP07_09435 [Polyangia bacterium]|jgi:hypothetical protein